MPLDPEQRARLLAAKLRVLVASTGVSIDDAEEGTLGTSPTLRVGEEVWLLAEEEPHRLLGAALARQVRGPSRSLHLLAEDPAAGVLARRAGQFREPPTVWRVEGPRAVPAEPSPVGAPEVPPPAALGLLDVLRAAGVEVVIEHGQVIGEVLGLEIARAVVDEAGTARIEVGVGQHDREAFSMLHGQVPAPEALVRVVEAVRAQRHPGATTRHPLARLAGERWLRSLVIGRPELVGARVLEPIEGTVARRSVKDTFPAFALGVRADGSELVVACSTGIDLDLVPHAADVRASRAPAADLVLVLPRRDDHPVTRALAAALTRPAAVVVVDDDWRA